MATIDLSKLPDQPKGKSFDLNMLPNQPKKKSKVLTGIKNFGIGLAQSGGETLAGIGSILEKSAKRKVTGNLPAPLRPRIVSDFMNAPTLGQRAQDSGAFTPTTTGQKLGKFTGDVAQFAIPATKVAKLQKGAGLLPRALGQAGAGAGVEALKQGELNRNVTTTGAISGALPFAGAGIKKVFSPERLMTKALGLTPSQIRSLDKIASTKIKGSPAYKSVSDFAAKKGMAGGREEMVAQAEDLFSKALKSKKNVLQNITKKTANTYDDVLAYLQRVYNKEGLNQELKFINKITKKKKLSAVELDKIRKLVDDTLYGAAYSGDEKIAQKGVQRLVDPIRKTLEKLDKSGNIRKTNTDIRILRKLIGEKGALEQSAKRNLINQLTFRGAGTGLVGLGADLVMPGAGRAIGAAAGVENVLLGLPQVSSNLAKGITKASATKTGRAIPRIVQPLIQGASRNIVNR